MGGQKNGRLVTSLLMNKCNMQDRHNQGQIRFVFQGGGLARRGYLFIRRVWVEEGGGVHLQGEGGGALPW